jgi:hypothetical protein
MSVLTGCCGWPMGRAKYFEHFPVVELQDPFYEPPSIELATKWRASAPPDFRYHAYLLQPDVSKAEVDVQRTGTRRVRVLPAD